MAESRAAKSLQGRKKSCYFIMFKYFFIALDGFKLNYKTVTLLCYINGDNTKLLRKLKSFSEQNTYKHQTFTFYGRFGILMF